MWTLFSFTVDTVSTIKHGSGSLKTFCSKQQAITWGLLLSIPYYGKKNNKLHYEVYSRSSCFKYTIENLQTV